MKTLSQMFTPPEGYVGQICVASALSADVIFLDKMLTEFTGRSNSKRREIGDVNLLLMLDIRSERLDMDAASGFLQLQPYGKNRWEKISCMHAKVAIMQFGKTHSIQSRSKTTDLIWRLVVCTGNWTESSAYHQIEMAWSTDYDCNAKKQDRNSLFDMECAVNFMERLQHNYAVDKRIWAFAEIMFKGIKKSAEIIQGFHKCRFFTTFNKVSMLDSIKEQFKNVQSNFVIAGSGFYEQDDGKNDKPETIKQIEQKLKLTEIDKKDRHLIVNVGTAGKIAVWSKNSLDWSIHIPSDPVPDANRFMHAKFIYAGVKKRTIIGNGKLYLGSGNLSATGLLGAGKRKNIEAGIVINQSDFCNGVNRLPEKKLFELLLCGDEESSLESKSINENIDDDEFEGGEVCYKDPCPLLAFELVLEKGKYMLRPNWLDNKPAKGVILKRTKDIVGKKNIAIMDVPSEYEVVAWNRENYQVPVIIVDDGFVRFSAHVAPAETQLSLEELLSQLESSLYGRDDDNNDNEPDKNKSEGHKSDCKNTLIKKEVYKYQSAMTLVESIAEYNQIRFPKCDKKVRKEDIRDWIAIVDCKLRNLSNDLIKTWQSLEVNFISVLSEKNFAPPCKGSARTLWNNYVGNLSKRWQIDKFEDL